MPAVDPLPDVPFFRPVVVGALYPGIERGLGADLVVARALDAVAHPICSVLVVASHGRVTEVLDVPSDSVDAQLQHVLEHAGTNAVKLGALGSPATTDVVLRLLARQRPGPIVFDLTLSGPSGEELASPDALDVVRRHLNLADLVTIRLDDAQLLVGIEIRSLDDAQVAVQRIQQAGARSVLLRCGSLGARHFDSSPVDGAFMIDLLYDGEDFSLFEAPRVDLATHGISSGLTLGILSRLHQGRPLSQAVQFAKSYVTEALQRGTLEGKAPRPHYFWLLERAAASPYDHRVDMD
jgi:hydroxymethylpyrimidine/phosphomethylpyrimidine kinase